LSRYWLLAIGGGAASVLIYSLAGSVPGGLLFAYFTALPLYLVGLGLGLAAMATASVTATVGVWLPGGGVTAMVFLVITAMPATLFIRQALLSRNDAQGNPAWYPAGNMVLTLCVLGAVLFSGAALWLSFLPDGFEGSVKNFTQGMAENLLTDSAAGFQEQFVAKVAPILPGFAVASWLIMNLVNAVLAQGILTHFQSNLRPSPEIAQMELPYWIPLAVVTAAATAAGLLLPDSIGYFGGNLAIILFIPFFFIGLAVAHTLCRNKPAGPFLLILLYGMLIFFNRLIIFVAALGLIEQWFGLRRRLT
jgi:uncharacterized protein YybS (DUF2232 family)